MARKSKLAPVLQNTVSSNPGSPSPAKIRDPDRTYCTRCGRSFIKQRNNFPASQSPLFKENGGFLPVCRRCVDEMYEHYLSVLGNEALAVKRICMKFDIYWNDNIYRMLKKTNATTSRALAYISKTNLVQYAGKTFDDTLDEESLMGDLSKDLQEAKDTPDLTGEAPVSVIAADEQVTQSMIDFWGAGLSPSFYLELEKRYQVWCSNYPDPSSMDVGEQAVIRQICMLEVTINHDIADGKSADKSINTLNTLLGSANLKPVQKKENIDAATEMTPFGVWIRKIEDTRPISEPDPELQDVDGIIKYVSVWVLGHLCKMLKIHNTYSELYEEEMAKLRVERPEYEGEDETSVFEDIFDRAEQHEQSERESDTDDSLVDDFQDEQDDGDTS